MIDYSGPLIVSNDMKDVYIGLMSLGAILNGPSEKMICEHFDRAMKIIVDLLGSSSTKIREASSWLIH